VLFAVTFLAMALLAYMPAPACAIPGGTGQATDPSAEGRPFDRHGMWIWYVERSEGGDLGRIIARAHRAGIGTVYVKSGDAGNYWSQFNSGLVRALHAGGLDVCAWQFVYGDSPVAEAKIGAAAVSRGADCLAIDAEGQYEGRYASAERYIRALRARIGAGFPLSLAGFPYVDYHPAFPYSVFFGPEGATFNQPQMYWKAIGTSVRGVYEHTYLFNRLWGHPVYPIGQTYGNPGSGELLRFRRFAASYGGLAPSWWDWQETSTAGWGALGSTADDPLVGYRPIVDHPLLKRGSRGDLVVWAQEHLVGSGQAQLPVTGVFGRLTYTAVRSFQASHGLAADGAIGTTTWASLLDAEPARPRWAARRLRSRRGAGASRVVPARRPLSASLPAHAYEIDPGPAP
jgi:peptidoglycan hydrolase-like protein with peptidoglycan-binding domain